MPSSLDFEHLERATLEVAISKQTGQTMLRVTAPIRGEERELLWVGRIDELIIDLGRDHLTVIRSDGSTERRPKDDMGSGDLVQG